MALFFILGHGLRAKYLAIDGGRGVERWKWVPVLYSDL